MPRPPRPTAPLLALLIALASTAALLSPAVAEPADSSEPSERGEPVRAEANPDAEQAAAAARVPEGFKVDLWAAEPLLENPVAIDVDEYGRVFVVETHRLGRGVTDNRSSGFWIDDDLAAMTVDDRLAFQKEWAERGERSEAWYTDHAERLRLLIDETGDGRADVSHTFADGFNDPLHGVAAGVLAYRGDIYFANIPHLYRLRDTTGDHHADESEILHRGYGVRTAFIGHDLHGLTLGPDGKLYFSIGDRGYHIERDDGSVITDPKDPGRGAVFRCNLDGSDLEVVYYGLRNPQDLAFDKHGNLFTVDNDADGVDRSRVLYLLEGGDAGWSMNFQYMDQRGPWELERWWETENDDQPHWLLPPLYYLSAGPSGFEFNPGLGLPERYDDYFFLVDFRGNAANSGIHAFTLEQDGAAFSMVDPHEFIWNVLATDIKFGYDGYLYISDWQTGWGIRQPPVGRIHRAHHEEKVNDPRIEELAELIREDFTAVGDARLAELLHHPDMRIRLRAQYELAERIDAPADAGRLRSIAGDEGGDFLPARLHAVWAMGQVLRAGHDFVLDALLDRLDDGDYHVRAQAAKVIGDAAADSRSGIRIRTLLREGEGLERLLDRLDDETAHVQALTAIALGKVGAEAALEPLMQLIHENADEDRYLRHAAVMGISGVTDADTLLERAASASAPQRLAIVLALRRHLDPRVAQFLDDLEEHIVREAATAIYDLNLSEAMPALAALLERYTREPTEAEPEMVFERRFYRDIPGTALSNLKNADRFPDEPDEVDHSTLLTIPLNDDDHYGTLVTGYLVPPQSGEYVFQVAADDQAELYLSTSDSREDKTLIASVPAWTGPHEYDKYPEQMSDAIELEAGRPYYIEVLHKEGEGGDHLNVGWRWPDGQVETPIGSGAGEDVPTALLRRVINANLALGDAKHADRVARFAADTSQPTALRSEALSVLEEWTAESPRDRVLNYARPLPPRDVEVVRGALEPLIVTIVDNSAGQLQSQATDLATELGLALDEETLMRRLADVEQGDEARIAVLRSLVGSRSPRARQAIGMALESSSPLLRAEGRNLLAQRDAGGGLAAFRQALQEGETVEKQQALVALGPLEHEGADPILVRWLDELLAGNVRPPLQLELIEAARQRSDAGVAERLEAYEASLAADDPLAAHRLALRGGDADAGRRVFFGHPAAQCIRCHTLDGAGGDAGPDLTGVGSRRSRSQLLADLLTPNESVAEGFGTVVLTLNDGRAVTGTLRDETDSELTVITPDGQIRTIATDAVATRTPPISAMPPMGGLLTPRELRDLIEFLATEEE